MERDNILYKIRRKGQVLASKILPKETLAKIYSWAIMKKRVDLKNPQTFNEKIQWCKIHYYPRNPLVVQCADKYAVRAYLEKKNLQNLLVPSYGNWTDARDIDWDKLPARFVLKCAHGCAYNILCPNKDTLDKKRTIKQLNKWLKEDFGAFNVEPHYSQINPRMIVSEEYLGDCITDYKFYCFNGEPRFMYVSNDMIHDRQAQLGFFYMNGEKMPMTRDDYIDLKEINLPTYFEEMQQVAKILCQDFPFVRVDFFITDDRFYFAELTFSPAGGMMPFNPRKYDLEWGQMLNISELIEKYGN